MGWSSAKGWNSQGWSRPAAAAGGGFTTLDPSKKSASLSLDASKLIATATASTDEIVGSIVGITSGQRWMEFKLLAASASGPWCGGSNGVGGWATGQWAGASPGNFGAYVVTGPIWCNSTSDHTDDAIITLAVGGYLMLLIDKVTTTYTAFGGGTNAAGVFRYRSGGASPVDSQTYPLPSGTIYVGGGTSANLDNFSVNYGQATPVNTIPSGFGTI